ncbi:MAG TPA: hypothetical protein PLI79_05560 [Mycobacterium sp.]|nr:hypothetical protein [Mycobacterium sp.]
MSHQTTDKTDLDHLRRLLRSVDPKELNRADRLALIDFLAAAFRGDTEKP